MCYGNGLFVAVAATGTHRVMTSPDGITWTARTAAENNYWCSVCYGNGLFVATASDGTNRIMTSPDGINWTAHMAPENNLWESVTYGNGLFVAVSRDGTNRLMTSPDGINWTVTASPAGQAWNLITYGNGRFVGVATSGTYHMMTSDCTSPTPTTQASAINFTNVEGTSFTINWTNGSGSKRAVFVKEGTGSITDPTSSTTYTASADWNQKGTQLGTSGYYCVYNGTGNSVALANLTGNTQYTVQVFEFNGATGSELYNTTTATDNPNSQTTLECYAGQYWTPRPAIEDNAWYSVCYGNGLYVATSGDGTHRVMTSPDGITWTPRTAAEANSWNSVCYGNGLFVAIASTGTHRVMTSPDGITWTARTAAEDNTWFSVAYGNGLYVAVGYNGTHRVMTSPDGINWTARTAAEDNLWRCVTYGNGLFVAVAVNGTHQVMTSSDGITWTPRTAAEDNSWSGVTYGNSTFVAVSNGGTHRVMTSPDGITWTPRNHAQSYSWFIVTYGNGLFVALSQNGINPVMTSPDGINWTSRTASETNPWYSITFGNGKFVAVSYNGTNRVMTSDCLIPPPSVSTQAVSAISSATATANGTITVIYSSNASSRGAIIYPYTDSDKIIGDLDVTNIAETGNFVTGTFTASLTSLSVNAQYNVRAYAGNTIGTGYGSRVSFWTLANVPSTPTVNNPTTTSLDVTVNANGNPSTTEFAIYEINTNKYVQVGGTLNTDPDWQTAGTWLTKTVTSLTPGTTYNFQVKARNGNHTETALSTSAQATTLIPTINIKGNNVSITNGESTPSTSNDTDFGNCMITSSTVVKTFTVENTGTASLLLSGDPIVSITGAADFTVTQMPSSPISASSSTTFKVTFDPTTLGLKSATISIANNDSHQNPFTFAIQGTGINVPTTQASNITSNSTTATTTTIMWTRGDGQNRVVFMKAGVNTGSQACADGTTYTASTDWSVKGTEIAPSTGWHCIYNGSDATPSVNLTNLSSGEIYRIEVFEYNGSAGAEFYLTTSGTNNPKTINTKAISVNLSKNYTESVNPDPSYWDIRNFNSLATAIANSATGSTITIKNQDGEGYTATSINTDNNTFIVDDGDLVLTSTTAPIVGSGLIQAIGDGYLVMSPQSATSLVYPVTDGTYDYSATITSPTTPTNPVKVRIHDGANANRALTVDLWDIQGDAALDATIKLKIPKASITSRYLPSNTIIRRKVGSDFVMVPPANISIVEFGAYYEVTIIHVNQF